MLLTYFLNFICFQDVSDQQIFGGFALSRYLSCCVSRAAFKGGFICPSQCESAFSGQSLSLFRRLRCIPHKQDVVSLFLTGFFKCMQGFFGRSPIYSVSIEQLIWHYIFFFFFLVSCHGRNVPGVCLSYQLTKKKHFSTSVFALHTEH